ncbi:3-oxoadipate enol-lactonase/3-oxoadipate enol-lactonase/4-carboxymuconolactone decarboxylase [Roseibium hamelinense]|uniref:3-oxoadipate enol-lactonase/3-oxoadipate enol-lactonase/4-carboxymuconolactone decarboxylase n=1 Tax=Roseibium hamelinense TaxID=150831 RepID=A0A562T7T8_9HYPH|nr:3-oxoadipate enol-lactonase [Roseibium hamelinense]MTI43500.1 3-oxoadipate enol-lactonase [Roseibium hamelinense]TWI89707.1 3-oxoadipate enol-lactonase/3-oxoadipate enol-lactonase/4-carboxymuconolactone decarboxylase [Roseibium hamelinense]
MQMISVNGVNLHYADTGVATGTALVFLNSLGTDFRIWDHVVPAFEDRFRIVRADKRGHGLSQCVPGGYGLSDLVGDVEALCDALGVDQVIAVGLSVGGLIAQGFAARSPDRVPALILCDTASRIGDAATWTSRMSMIEQDGLGAIADAVLERWFPPSFKAAHPAAYSGWHAMLTRTPTEGYLATCAILKDTDHTAETKALKMPALCLCGSADGATPPALVKATADMMPNARFVEIPEAGHVPCIDQPDAVIRAMKSFFEEHGLV